MKSSLHLITQRLVVLLVSVISVAGGLTLPVHAQWTESWNAAAARIYPFDEDDETFVSSDRGRWVFVNTTGDPGVQVEVESVRGNKRLKLTVNDGEIQASLQSPRIPVSAGSKLSITITANLVNPYWNRAFPTVFPPPGDNVHLRLEDNRGNSLVYIFQRAANYPAHNTTLDYINSITGKPVKLGYGEVLVGDFDSPGGVFVLDLYADFSRVPLFNPSGATIEFIEFEIGGTGMATMDDLRIGAGVTGTSPTVIAQPQSKTVTAGASVAFALTATGAEPLTYTWQRKSAGSPDWNNLSNSAGFSGATTSTLTLSSASEQMNGDEFRCIVANATGSVSSSAARLTVNPAVAPPAITIHPSSQAVNAGANVTFLVEASGTRPLAYQWQKDGANIPGATAATYSIPEAPVSAAGIYRVIVSNSAGSVPSQNAVLTVTAPVECLVAFVMFPKDTTAFAGDTVEFRASAEGTCGVAYQWLFGGNPIPGATNSSLVAPNLTFADAGTYQVRAISGNASITANVQLTIEPLPGALPDLIISRLTVDGITADQIAYSYDIANRGTAGAHLGGTPPAFADRPSVQAYMSPDGDINNPLNRPTGGTVLTVSSTGILPVGGIFSGRFSATMGANLATHPYLILQIRHDSARRELNEANNVAVTLITPSQPVLVAPLIAAGNTIRIEAAGLWDRMFSVESSDDCKSWEQKFVLDGKAGERWINDAMSPGRSRFYRLREMSSTVMHQVVFSDSMGDGGATGDLVEMALRFNPADGSYQVRVRANDARPFTGHVRFNLNLWNSTRLAVASPTSLYAIFSLTPPAIEISYSGVEPGLRAWQAGDTVQTFHSSNVPPGSGDSEFYSGPVNLDDFGDVRDRVDSTGTITKTN